jgi:UDP-N-acetyl-2-amino-2-deoxyglucuronate dehydrogenase
MNPVSLLQGPIGFGIVGLGSIAHTHAEAIRALEHSHNVHLVGVLGRSAEKTQAFAEKHHVPFYTTEAAAFFDHPDIHAVCIMTPSGAHLEPALQAIRSGRHLVVEKPLEITLARVDEMLTAAGKAGVLVAGIFQARYAPGVQKLKQALDSGRFGRLSLCSAAVKWHRSAEYYQGWKGTLALDGGGALMNQAIHAVDLLQYLAGMPTDVFGWKTRCVHQGIEAEDTVSASLRFAHGALGSIEATTAAWPGWARRIEICGEFGSASLEDEIIAHWEFRDSRTEDAEVLAGPKAPAGAHTPQIGFGGHQRQIEDLVHALRTGEVLQVDGRAARNAVEIVCAVYQSAASGLPVHLPSV